MTHPATRAAQPNLILVTIDTVRADRMGFLGSRLGLTPNLDALAREGVVFEHAYAQAPLTPTSHATILTGTYPQFHGVADFGLVISPKATTLAEVLRAEGYRTAAFVGSIVLDPVSGLAPGFDRGFERYEAGFHLGRVGLKNRYQTVERRAEDVVARAIAWIGQNSNSKFFVWVHLYDPHDPYDPPTPFARRFAPYDGEIAYTDFAIGKLIQALKSQNLYTSSLIAVMGDHGEALGDHGETSHGIFLYDPTIRVPFLFKLPGVELQGRSIAEPVELVDFAPTALGILGLRPPASMQGTSLLSRMQGKSRARRPAYAETDYPRRAFGWSALASLRAGKYLFIKAPRNELYDLSTDPEAKTNLAGKNSALAVQLRDELEAIRARYGEKSSPASAPLGPEELEKLRALGYVGYAAATGNSRSSGVDPKDRVKVANAVHQGILAGEVGRPEEAVQLFREVVREDPQIFVAEYQLGLNLMRLKRYAEAIPPLEKAVVLRPDAAPASFQLGMALYDSGKLPESAAQFERAVRAAPKWADAHYSLASVYARIDRVPDAIRELQMALELNPQLFNAHLLLGRIFTLQGHAQEAVPHLQRAVSLEPQNAEAHAFLADAYARLGRETDAKRERGMAESFSSRRP